MNFLRKFRALFRKEKLDAEMSEEMHAHLEMQTQQNIARGMSPDEARYAARRSFGGVEQVKERARDERGWLWFDQFRQDLRYALRQFARAKGFAAVVVLTLGLGIGANTALFTVVEGVLLNAYPYRQPDRILMPPPISAGFLPEVSQLPVVAEVAADRRAGIFHFTGEEWLPPEAMQVSGGTFAFLGVPAVLGRTLQPADILPGGEAAHVIVLAHGSWRRYFGGDPGVIGQMIDLKTAANAPGEKYTVIGVMPSRFRWKTQTGGNPTLGWTPLPAANIPGGPSAATPVSIAVRLRTGVTPEVASGQMEVLYNREREAALTGDRPTGRPASTALMPYTSLGGSGRETMVSSLRLLFCAVGFLLAIACANVANLQMARAAGRSREFAVRLSLGASRGRLIRQLLTESAVLVGLGGAFGLLLAVALSRITFALMPARIVPAEAEIAVNGTVLMFSAAVTVLSGIVFGLVPAIRSTRPDCNDALKESGHALPGGIRGRRTQGLLVVAQVAFAVLLLVGGMLSIRGYFNLLGVKPGYRAERTYSTLLRPPSQGIGNELNRPWLDRIKHLPGIEAATIGSAGFQPGGPATEVAYRINGVRGGTKIGFTAVDEGYFGFYGMTVTEGRTFAAGDVDRRERVAVINQTAARLWAGGQSPIGRTIDLSLLGEFTVIGVINDVRNHGLRKPVRPLIAFPYTLGFPGASLPLTIRVGEGQLASASRMLRAEVAALDNRMVLAPLRDMEQEHGLQFLLPRFNLMLFGSLGGIALALAMAGIYGVLSYHVAQRTREIGIRLALGATRGTILRMVASSGVRLLTIGLCLGGFAGAGLTRVVKSQVFDVPTTDPWALVAAVAILGIAALAVCYLPARRATRVDPMVALRAE